jgi:GLPGLI family protein
MQPYYITFLCLIISLIFGKNLLSQPRQYVNVSRSLEKVNVLDSATIKFTYSLEFVADSTDTNKKWTDRKILLIGDSIQHFYSYYGRIVDSAATVDAKGVKPYGLLSLPQGVCAERYEIYNYPNKQRIVLESMSNLSIFIYKEDFAMLSWTMSNNTMTVLNYLCYKATCRFRGRNWEAWFTPEIPIKSGPWKLHGLPGMILKAAGDRQHYVFECIGIEQFKKPKAIITYGIPPINSFAKFGNRENFLKAQKNFYNNYVNALLAMGYYVGITDDEGKTIEMIPPTNDYLSEKNAAMACSVHYKDRYRKIPYNPIELE